MIDDVVLDFKQLETFGNHFLEIIMKMKHNGAIDKTRGRFIALCNRLLCDNNPRLTKSSMEQLMDRTVAKQQTIDDLLRRSAWLDGEATECMIKELDEDREEFQDPEVEFAIANAVWECIRMETLLEIVHVCSSYSKLMCMRLMLGAIMFPFSYFASLRFC